jgi:ssDNA-binding Zn-finger/Zn-ribbon topoisomerase 1
MGAINETTNKMEYADVALKKYKYSCPECSSELILRQGIKNVSHFAHKSLSNCCYYDRQGETALHHNAKYLLKNKLDNKQELIFNRKCESCNNNMQYQIKYDDNSIAKVEYGFKHLSYQYFADVALITDDKIEYIFEILATHKTLECNRHCWLLRGDKTNAFLY